MNKQNNIKPQDLIRQRRGPVPEALNDCVKESNKIKKAIRAVLEGSDLDPNKAKTVPMIAKETKIASNIIHWHLTSMRKYGTATESNLKDGQYPKWVLIPKEPKKKKMDEG